MEENKMSIYPENLLEAIKVNQVSDVTLDYRNLSRDQLNGLEYAIRQLKENEQEIIRFRYEEGLSYNAIGRKINRSGSRVGQIHAKALRRLRSPRFRWWYVEGYEAYRPIYEAEIEKEKHYSQIDTADPPERSCASLGLSFGILRCLHDAGIDTVGMLQNTMKKPLWYSSIKGIGEKYAEVLVCKKLGVEAWITATGTLACWQKGSKSRPVTPEVLHYYFRDGMGMAEIAHCVERKNARNYVHAWRGRMLRASLRYAFFLWVIHGASYTITAEDIMNWQAELARKRIAVYRNKGKTAEPTTWELYIMHCRDTFLREGSDFISSKIPQNWSVYAEKCYRKLQIQAQKFQDVMTGKAWIEAAGLPEGYGLIDTGPENGICTIWKEDLIK